MIVTAPHHVVHLLHKFSDYIPYSRDYEKNDDRDGKPKLHARKCVALSV